MHSDVRHFPQKPGGTSPTSRHLCTDQIDGRKTGGRTLAAVLCADSFSLGRLPQVSRWLASQSR